jgi:5-methylcytosine-specific restriction endonuclease McrA
MNISERMKEEYRTGKRKSWNKGLKCTYGEKTSKTMKGIMPKNLSLINANKKGSGNPMFGKHSSQKQKDAARITCLKRWNNPVESLKIRNKMSASQKGNKGSNWQGGKTSVNETIRHGIEFRLWRESVFVRDNWTCQKCKIKGGYLHPHHIKNFSKYPELRFAIDNGITFCQKCHKEFHSIYGMTKNNEEQIIKYIKNYEGN